MDFGHKVLARSYMEESLRRFEGLQTERLSNFIDLNLDLMSDMKTGAVTKIERFRWTFTFFGMKFEVSSSFY